MKTSLTAALLALAAPLAARAQESPSPWIETRFHRIHLRNGNFIDGQLLQETRRALTLNLQKSGEFVVYRDLIERVEYIKMRSLREAPPAPLVEAPKKEEDSVKIPAPETTPDPVKAPSLAALEKLYSPETRGSIERLLSTHAAADPVFRRDLEPQILALGPDGVAYACLLARTRKQGVDHPALILALGKLGGPDVLPTLLEILRSPVGFESRTAVIQALLFQDSPTAIEAVHRAVDDSSAQVRKSATEAVIKLGEKGLANEGILIEMLKAGGDKSAIANVLGKLGNEAALDALSRLLQEGEAPEKIAALQALGAFRRTDDGAYAAGLLDHANPFLRKEASLFLGRMKYGPAVLDLIATLEDEDASVGSGALWSLRQITGETYGADTALWKTWWERAGRRLFGSPSEN